MTFSPALPTAAVRLESVQSLAVGGRWRTEALRSYRMPVLLWFTRGQGRITVNGITRGYGAHNAVFVPARVMHGFEVGTQVFGTAVFFNDAAELALPGAPLHLRVRDGTVQAEMATLLEHLQRELDGARPLRDRAVLHHAHLLSVWLARQIGASEDALSPSAALTLARRFARMLEDQIYTGQSVSDYAEALGVTPTHLSRVCRATCGRPASDIIADRVTFEARRLLSDTPMPVKRVAEVLGFRSPAYFTRTFQARTGQTPTAFRASNRR